MNNQIIDQVLYNQKLAIDDLLQDLQKFAIQINKPELHSKIRTIQKNTNEPFLLVIVGEVKAGKSSFINAIIQEQICKTDVEPCTDVIQQIVYSEEQFEIEISPTLRKIGLPIDILKTLSIVDTPGTNTILENHQEITENYIPNSDLVFFVFFAKNPYHKTAWELLDYVSEQWRKKVVFILQQSDLTKPEELSRNTQRVKEYASQRHIESPIVFATSAELENNGNEEGSGFREVRGFINDMVTGGETYKIKLKSISDRTQNVIDELDDELKSIQRQLELDKSSVERIKTKLAVGEKKSQDEISKLVDKLAANYDRVAEQIKSDFSAGFTFPKLINKSVVGTFNKNASIQAWIDQIKAKYEPELQISLEETLKDGTLHFLGDIKNLIDSLIQDLNTIQNYSSNSHLSIRVIERRHEVFEDVKQKASKLLEDADFINSLKSNASGVATNILGGGAVTVIAGLFIMGITEIVIFDLIGAAFAGVGILVSGGALYIKKRMIISKIGQKLESDKTKLISDINQQINFNSTLIYEEIKRVFRDLDDYVEKEEEGLEPILKDYRTIQSKAKDLLVIS